MGIQSHPILDEFVEGESGKSADSKIQELAHFVDIFVHLVHNKALVSEFDGFVVLEDAVRAVLHF